MAVDIHQFFWACLPLRTQLRSIGLMYPQQNQTEGHQDVNKNPVWKAYFTLYTRPREVFLNDKICS